MCAGFSAANIASAKNPLRAVGFLSTAAEAIRNRASFGQWPYPSSAIGVSLLEGNAKPQNSYLVHAPVRRFGFRDWVANHLGRAPAGGCGGGGGEGGAGAAGAVAMAEGGGGEGAVGEEVTDERVLRSVLCLGVALPGEKNERCIMCDGIKRKVHRSCDSAAQKRTSLPLKNEPHNQVTKSPGRAMQLVAGYAQKVRLLRQKLRRLAATFRTNGGIEIEADSNESEGSGQQAAINSALVDAEKAGKDALEAMGFADENCLERVIWDEAVENAKKEQAAGTRRACRYNPLTIKFAMTVLASTGNSSYEKLRSVFHLPTRQHLGSFKTSSAEDDDGLLHGVLEAMEGLADAKGYSTWQRHGALCLDSMKLRAGLYWSAHSKAIIGFAFNAYEKPDIMKAEFTRQAKKARGGTDDKDPVQLAKDYLVFYFTSYDPKANIRFPVARYCLGGVTAGFLIDTIPEVLAGLDDYGFVGISVTGDGAGENRSALGKLADIPASAFIQTMVGQEIDVQDVFAVATDSDGYKRGVVTGHVSPRVVTVRFDSGAEGAAAAAGTAGGAAASGAAEAAAVDTEVDLEQEEHRWVEKPKTTFHNRALPPGVDLEKKVAFKHPTRPGVFVMVWQDMPHLIKRTVNTLESSDPGNGKKRKLARYYEGAERPMCLKMIRDVWERQGGASVSQIRTTKLSVAHFEKNCFSRMRVSLSLQAVSRSVATMLEEFAAAIAEMRNIYAPLIELCRKLDRIVDIWNSRSDRGAPIINSAHHSLLYEALEILEWFSVWRDEVAFQGVDLEVAFLGQALWEDLNGLVLGLVCTCRFYLPAEGAQGGRALVQRRGDQDPCEHHFAHVRAKGGGTCSVSAYRARGATGVAGDVRVIGGGSGNNSTAGVDKAMAACPLAKKPKPTK